MRHVPLLYGCAIPHTSALEVLSGNAPPPPASLETDDPPQPPASLLRCLQQCFSKDFVFDNHVFLGFLPFFLDSFEICQIKRCFVVFWDQNPFRWCFSWRGGSFPCKILFFWYFLDFQRFVRVRYAFMTNKKPLGGVVCHYCHNPGHVRRNYRKLQNKN